MELKHPVSAFAFATKADRETLLAVGGPEGQLSIFIVTAWLISVPAHGLYSELVSVQASLRHHVACATSFVSRPRVAGLRVLTNRHGRAIE